MIIAPPPSHLSAGGRRGRPSYQKNGRARNRQRPLAAIVSVRACHKTLKVLEGSSQPAHDPSASARTVIIGLSRHTSALGTELALPSAIARRRGPAHGASRPPHRAGRTQHTPSTAAQTPPQFNPQRHAGVTTRSASRSASRSAGRRTFCGRSPTRGRGQGRAWRCRRWRLPKRRSPRRIRKSSGRRGGRAGAEAEEGDEPGCEGVEALGVWWPRANPRVAVCFR